MKRLSIVLVLLAVAFSSRGDQGPNQKKGFNADNVYSTHDIDAINVFNGNLTVTVPLGPRFPLAEGLSYGLAAVSNANVWEAEVLDDPPDFTADLHAVGTQAEGQCDRNDGVMFAHPHRRANAGIGWIVTLGRLIDPAGDQVTDWTYESPDGSDHKLTTPAGTGAARTADGSYLRMVFHAATNTRTIEFPDGAKHTFRRTSMGGPWLPARIENRFGAYLEVDYKGPEDSVGGDVIPQGTYEWRLRDSHGRAHVVKFVKYAWEGSGRLLVDSIHLQAFNGATAKYKFRYTPRTIGRIDWAERCPGFVVNAAIQTLDRIEFPDDPSTDDEGVTNYSFLYDNGIDWIGTSGLLKEATLPAGGRIAWSYDQYALSRWSVFAPLPWIDHSYGVTKRELKPPLGSTGETPTWTYSFGANADYDPNTPGDLGIAVHQGRSLVVDPVGNQTASFFSINSWEYPPPDDGYYWSEYGKPFTRQHSEDGMFLSEVQYPPGVSINWDAPLEGALRAKYVLYESDHPPSHVEAWDDNWRLKGTRVKSFNADGTTEWVKTLSSDWDGFGHYRVTEVTGSGSTAKKISRTHYNAHLAPTTVIPTTQPWILNTFSSTETEYDGQVSRTEVCFDKVNSYPSTGFVTRKRAVRGAPDERKDLLTVYTATSDGNVATEKFYGGDAAENFLTTTPFDTCNAAPGTPRYTITHSYSYGVRAQSQYSGAPFKSLDLSVDPTGLPRVSRDTALAATTFEYNPAGQLRAIVPDGEAWTEYRYDMSPGGTPPASITVKQWPSTNRTPGSADVPLTETRYSYDAHGRLVQQANWLGGRVAGANGATRWSVVSNLYDLLGRKWKTTVPVSRDSGAFATFSAPGTATTYDALGRVTLVTQPDNSTIVTAYPKASVVTRTSNVQSRSSSGEDVVIAATTRERYDPFGHLVEVTEAFGRPEAVSTTYEYDEGDRLVHVTSGVQNRSFVYDGAGLLTSEAHPESGTTSYLYDAAGKVKQQTTPNATVVTNYDNAARVSSITHNGSVLKSFTYDSGTMALGKVSSATRVNDHGAVGRYTVTENFTYAAPAGRLKSKKTAVVKERNNAFESRTEFEDEYAYDELGANTSTKYPQCVNGCGSFAGPPREITNEFDRGLLKRVPGYTGDFTYHPNGLIAEFSRVNAGGSTGPRYQQSVGADGMARPSAIEVSGYCTNLSIVPPFITSKTVNLGASAGLTVSATGATAIQWYEVGSTTVIATGATLNVPVNQTTSYFARVLNGACSIDSDVAVVTVAVPLPTVTTGAVSSLTQNGAVLNGTVNPNGYSTTTLFEYGVAPSYGGSVAAQTLSGSTTQSISASVSGLACGTTYHFRAKGTNAGGPRDGADATFTTAACPQTPPPSVTTNAPSSVGQTSATFDGSVNAQGSPATTAFDFGPTTSYGSVIAAQTISGSTTQTIAASVSGLACGSTYHVRARATNAGGSAFGANRTFSTAACAPSPCTAEPISYSSAIGRTLFTSSCTAGTRPGYYVDIFTFAGNAGDVVQIDMNMAPGSFDPYLFLFAPNGSEVRSNDDKNLDTRDAQVIFRLTTSGTWTIHATTYAQGATGAYYLTINRCAAEPIVAPFDETRSLTGGSCAQTILGPPYFSDSYSLDGVAGQTLTVDMSSTDFDTRLWLVAPDGSIAADNDDFYGSNSHIAHSLPSSGKWTIRASTAVAGATGAYRLQVGQVSCPQPDPTIAAPTYVCTGAQETATAPLAAGYAWYIQNGTITSSSSERSITFEATGSLPALLTVIVTASCGATDSDTAEVAVANPTATVSGNHYVAQGQPQEIVATLTGVGPWTVVWSPGNVAQNVTSGPARRTVQPDVTTHYTISQVTDSTGCSGTATGQAVVTVIPAPAQMSANATSSTTVQLAWAFAETATDYIVERCASACSSASSWVLIGSTPQMSYTDAGAVANRSYLYRVRARKGGGTSLPSHPDVATTIVFGSDVATTTVVEDSPLLQLRTAVQAMSTLAGSPPPSFTGTTLDAAVVLDVHLSELRGALATARASMGLPAVAYSSPSTVIRAADINELRGGVR